MVNLQQNRNKLSARNLRNTEKYRCSYARDWEGLSCNCVSDSPHSRGVNILFQRELPVNIINIHKKKIKK